MDRGDDSNLCRICGDPATGVYYRVQACTACRSFYRRCVKKNVVTYLCRFGRRCAPHFKSSLGSTWCRACRYQKYRSLSENEDALLNGFWMSVNSMAEAESGDMNEKNAKTPDHQTSPSPPCADLRLCEMVDVTSARKKRIVPTLLDSRITKNKKPHKISEGSSYTNSVIRHTKLLSVEREQNRFDNVLPCNLEQFGLTDDSITQHIMTFQAVSYALQLYFGDQIAVWTEFRDEALLHGRVPVQPETDIDTLTAAINQYNTDNFRRTQQFALSLPGIRDFSLSCRRLMMTDWKCFICALIHVSPFMIDNESYFTLGSKNYRYCRYWQEQEHVTSWGYQVIVYKFCNAIRDIGLTDVERYLLIAVILLEPGARAHENYESLSSVHRHYMSVLTCAISTRCSDAAERTIICGKLATFFDLLKNIFHILREHFNPPNFAPPCCRALRHQLVSLKSLETPKTSP